MLYVHFLKLTFKAINNYSDHSRAGRILVRFGSPLRARVPFEGTGQPPLCLVFCLPESVVGPCNFLLAGSMLRKQ